MNIHEKIRKFGRMGVLMGGPSSEREISLRSGTAVYEALRNAGHDVIALDVKDEPVEAIKDARIKAAFIALHGKFGEDGTVQSMLEELDIPYTGSGPLASRMALDKISSSRVFRDAGINVPAQIAASSHDEVMAGKPKFPAVVKPASSGSSIGLSVVNDKNALGDALELAFRHDEWIIVEEFIEGREVTVGILEEKPLPVIEVNPKDGLFDYRAKYTPNLTEYIVPARLDYSTYLACQGAGEAAHRALGCRMFSRIDIIIGKKDNLPYVLEANTIPGFTGTSLLPKAARAAGINFLELCERLIYSALTGNEVKTKNTRPQKKART